MMGRIAGVVLSICVCACGPTARDRAGAAGGDCSPGDARACYTGAADTEGVGTCGGGMQTCTAAGQWGTCDGEVTPRGEICGNGVDDDCDGKIDEDTDLDGDGYTTCGGDCCDSINECGNPAEVNPGAFDVPGDGVDNDCDGQVDNVQLLCDTGLQSSSSNAMDYAKAMDLCQTASATDRRWGVLDAALTLPDGTGTPDPNQYSIRHHFGAKVEPQGGVSMALISSGAAAGKGDTAPAYHDFVSYIGTKSSGFPADFLAANGGKLPNAPGCPEPLTTAANDPVMLTLHVRVPTNAHSFSLKTNFFSSEFPEWTCSQYNDFFVVLLDSTYTGDPANPADKNLAIYTDLAGKQYPVGVNLAAGDTGLFTQCLNGTTGCEGTPGTITSCTGTDELLATGFDDAAPGSCDAGSLQGGATGWLTTSGNVVPGEVITLRIAIWDTSDHAYDSLAIVDGFQWSADPSTPGTVIFRRP
ncbi:MAG: choice-of-anchor L domain-containing protein [Acidobacteriota bacterium]